MNIGIVTVVYAEYPDVLFESLQGYTDHAIRWYVHCHSANPALQDNLIAFCSRNCVNLTLHGWNRGLSKSWNDGIIASYNDGSDITIVVNDDILFFEGSLSRWIEFISGYDNLGLAFLRGIEIAGPHSGELVTQDFACFAFGPAAYEHVGAFDENFFPAYSEDIDYITRAGLANISVVTDQRILVAHARNKTTRKSVEIRDAINPIKEQNEAFLKGKWLGPDERTVHARPWDKLPVKIEWADRRTPYGEGFDRKELQALEPDKYHLVSGRLQDSRTGKDHIANYEPPPGRGETEARLIVSVIYKALLLREAEAAAVDHHAAALLAGTASIDDVCTVVRSSREHQNVMQNLLRKLDKDANGGG